ncbi:MULTISPECIES: geranylfarnesyl diphosphate synthase [Methanosarcina]|jgi:octaprenyl-diphosphate synthase|uniref:Polyprenyl synthetase n=5 Tax=Methanosarcina mazei TaxID=2209 RepID=A0A0F8RB63_METMZ|nr:MULTISPECIES: geranylfarnesyl diphosphate synthase [Methanosarcina]AGF96216.1 polyprenyl synthetase [Methanosarcina mazei Tuc01]KKG01432.1 polyprenyl synthetase [Methanosarcina mazei]KKG02552.1 polyprenyl synthetase [Methanosarcina mazei]KKG05204.1 polyprenyl synthetase [Methanosarcina mazei]KKG26713.1 polyprenyl synthetase [Methanosarcina mazei]
MPVKVHGVILMNIEEWEEYRYVEAGIKESITLIEDPGLKKMVEHVCHSGGKRIRPIILLLVSEICSGSYSRSLNAALAVEMMHSASLIHDDLLDQGLVRRNLPSAPEKFGPSRALLCGDYLIAKSIAFISPYGEKVIQDFGKAGMDMAEGEVLDLKLEDESFGENDYFKCIYKKTASLFAISASIGAYTGGAEEELAERFSHFGNALGTAYQIVDDILEFLEVVEGKESKFTSETLPHIYMKSTSKEEALKKSIDCVKLHVAAAKETLETFRECPARDKLFQITDYITVDMLENL